MSRKMVEHILGISACPTTTATKTIARKYKVNRSTIRLLPELPGNSTQDLVPSPTNGSVEKPDSKRMNKIGNKADKFAHGVREHVRLGPKITEIVKGKLSLGARILQVGGVKRVFKKLFSVGEGERLLKACQCYLSTTAGPIAGLLFISNQKLAFCSERLIKFSSQKGESLRSHYKVVIPLEKIKRANQSENVKKPSEKYIEIVTEDDFEFWFMGFLNYQKALHQLQTAQTGV